MAENDENRYQIERTLLSKTRTLLANERTFLAWCRTSVGLIAFGFLIEKIGWYMKRSLPDTPANIIADLSMLSIFTMVSGVMVLLGSAVRFYRVRRTIGSGLSGVTPFAELLFGFYVVLVLLICVLALKMMF